MHNGLPLSGMPQICVEQKHGCGKNERTECTIRANVHTIKEMKGVVHESNQAQSDCYQQRRRKELKMHDNGAMRLEEHVNGCLHVICHMPHENDINKKEEPGC